VIVVDLWKLVIYRDQYNNKFFRCIDSDPLLNLPNCILNCSFFICLISEPRKEKTDSSNGNNNNALSPQEQQQQHQQHHANMHNMMMAGDIQGMMKPERPNSLGPKITKRINFYHGDNCEYLTVTPTRTTMMKKLINFPFSRTPASCSLSL
jgi:hypothetical protein